MNAASVFAAKGLILALGGSLSLTATPTSAPTAPATTSYLKVDLGATATHPLSGTYVNPPTGAVTLGSVPFTTANIALLTSGTNLDLTASTARPKSVYVLVNSAYGFASLKGQAVGRVHLTFSDATTQDADIVGDSQVREWWLGNGYLTTLSGTSASNVWQGQGQPATGIGTTPAVIDMLTVAVKATTANLASVSVQNLAGAPFDLMVSGLTVAYSQPALSGGTGGKGTGDKDDVNRVNPPTKPGKTDSDKNDQDQKNDDKNGNKKADDATTPRPKQPATPPKPAAKPLSARHGGDDQAVSQRSDD